MIKAAVVTGGVNAVTTEAQDISNFQYLTTNPGVPPKGNIGLSTNLKTGDFAVQATTGRVVTIKAGTMFVRATPSGLSERLFVVTLSADYSLTVPENTVGTRYYKVYLQLPAASLANPPVGGDLTEAACISVETSHSAAGESLTATNAIELAEITTANGYTTIVDTDINERRVYATPIQPSDSVDWNAANEIWTYASATTITVPTDATTKYTIGDRIKLKQAGTQKYFFITGVAATLLTITGGTSYTLTNAAISENYTSKLDKPHGFPTYLSWTPTVTYAGGTTNPTSTEVNLARFTMRGKSVSINIKATVTRGGGNRTSTYFSLPVAAIDTNVRMMSAMQDVVDPLTVCPGYVANTDKATLIHGATTSDGLLYLGGTYESA